MTAERNFYKNRNTADNPQAAAPQTVRGESLSDQPPASRVNKATHGRWIVNTGIQLSSSPIEETPTTGPSREAKQTLKGILQAVQLHREVHGFSIQAATEIVMGPDRAAAEHWETVSGFQSSIPMQPGENGEISQQEILDKAMRNAGPDHKGNAAKRLIATEIQKIDQAGENIPNQEENQMSPSAERRAQKKEAELVTRKHQALLELVASGVISKEEMAEDMAERQDIDPHDLYDFNQAVSAMIEMAEAIARIKKAQGDKPKDERLTFMNSDPRLLSPQLGRSPKYEFVPFADDRTAEVVTWRTTSESPDVVEEFGNVVGHVDKNGGLLVAQVPHSFDAAIQERYGHTEDGVLELTRTGQTSTVIYRYPHRSIR
jgi:hypothetical protein